MTQRALLTLTDEKLQEIYTNKKFRNEVAHAHGYTRASGESGLKTCSYPVEYTVTTEQQQKAQDELNREKAVLLKDIAEKNKLVFVGMGMTYEPRYEDDVCNHRIRTYFTNAAGNKFFIEFGTGRGDSTRIDHAIDITKQEKEERGERTDGKWINNYNSLERRDSLPKYTFSNLLNLVNREFGCKFTSIEVDNYTLSPDFICNSPK